VTGKNRKIMSEPEIVGDIVQRIMREMQATFAKLHGARPAIDLWDEPPPPAPAPHPWLRLLKGGKESPWGHSSPD
jgi:hypothetical protein